MHVPAFEQRRLGHHLFAEGDHFDCGLLGLDGQSQAGAEKMGIDITAQSNLILILVYHKEPSMRVMISQVKSLVPFLCRPVLLCASLVDYL